MLLLLFVSVRTSVGLSVQQFNSIAITMTPEVSILNDTMGQIDNDVTTLKKFFKKISTLSRNSNPFCELGFNSMLKALLHDSDEICNSQTRTQDANIYQKRMSTTKKFLESRHKLRFGSDIRQSITTSHDM